MHLKMRCNACHDKGSGWPVHLSYFGRKQTCPWCLATKEVTAEVAAILDRLMNEPGIRTIRLATLRSRAYNAKTAWDELRPKKRPKGFSENEWPILRAKIEQQAIATAKEVADAEME